MKKIIEFLKKVFEWLGDSHRLLHLLLGMVFGLFANTLYCAIYGGAGVAGALEFKDYQWGGKPDWIDFILTFGGTVLGFLVRILVIKMF